MAEPDETGWSGDGTLTRTLLDALAALPGVRFLKVEDAPASRAGAGFTFVSNEIFVALSGADLSSLPALAGTLARVPDIGPPDYEDERMVQYLRTERIVRPYQTQGYKVIEMVRVYLVDRTIAPRTA